MRTQDSISLQALMDQQPLRDQTLERARLLMDSPDERTAASVLWKRLALDLLAPATVRWLGTGRAELPRPEGVLWRGDKGLWALPAQDDSHPLPLESDTVPLEQWLAAMEGFFRQQWRVSKGSFWSTAALACARPYTIMLSRLPADEWLEPAREWLASLPSPVVQFLRWKIFPGSVRPLALPLRRGCCMSYRLPDGKLCGTCGRHGLGH